MLLTLVDEAVPQFGEEAVFAAFGTHGHTESDYTRFYDAMVERRAHVGPAALSLAGMVGWCRLTVSKPELKAPMGSAISDLRSFPGGHKLRWPNLE